MSESDDLRDATLRQSDRFASTFDGAGQCLVYELGNPTRFMRLPELARAVLSCFPGTHDVPVSLVIATCTKQTDAAGRPLTSEAILAIIADLRRQGVLVHGRASHAFYTPEMVAAYGRSRAVPREIARTMVEAAPVTPESRVLDVGAGTASVAVELAAVTPHVTCLDVSPEFLDAGRAAASAAGRSIRFVNDSANRLVFSTRRYDVVIASQVLHWLEPSLGVRGIALAPTENGSIFAIESKASLPAGHPLRERLQYGATSGAEARNECVAHARRHETLLAAVSRRPLAFERGWIFRQRRGFDLDFARAYFFDARVAEAFGGAQDAWARLAAQLDALPPADRTGEMYWLLAKYATGATRADVPVIEQEIS